MSSVFAAMFSGSWDNNSNAIPIEDASYESFGQFIDFFYKGKLELNTQNIDEIFYLAHKYDVGEIEGISSRILILMPKVIEDMTYSCK